MDLHHLRSINELENVTEISHVGTILVSDQMGIKNDDPRRFRRFQRSSLYLFSILFLNENQRIDFDLIVEPTDIFVMHPDTACGYVFANGGFIVVAMDAIRI